LSQNHCYKRIFPPLNNFCIFLKKINRAYWHESVSGFHFWVFKSVPLISMSFSLPISHSFGYFRYLLFLWIWVDWSSTLFLFFQILLAILVPLPFHVNFRVILTICLKCLAGMLTRILLNLCFILSRIDTFTPSTLPIHGMICLFILYHFNSFDSYVIIYAIIIFKVFKNYFLSGWSTDYNMHLSLLQCSELT
jgi:hypothetical protein